MDLDYTALSSLVGSEEEFDRLPEDGRFEVVDGRAILFPTNDCEHQNLSDVLVAAFRSKLKALGFGFAVSAVNVFIPPPSGSLTKFQSRIPDIAVSLRKPIRRYVIGQPPELVIEILATPRGNVERTEKLDDYARAGIGEYWIVDPLQRRFEVYVLQAGEYELKKAPGKLHPRAFQGLEIDPQGIWSALD